MQLQGFTLLQETLFFPNFPQLFSRTRPRLLQIISVSSFPRWRSLVSSKTAPKLAKNYGNPIPRKLTCRIVELTRRRQLHQIFEEVEQAKRRYGKLNTIVMNAVMEACVHCGDLDSAIRVFQEMSKPGGCGVDNVTFGTLLKGLGEARRIDEAFLILESVEQGTAVGNPKLSPPLIYGLLNALLEAGDMRRANGLLARYRSVLHEGGPTILTYNLLIKGHTNTDSPLDALIIRDEIFRQGLRPDRLTYNTLIFACVKSGRMDSATQLFAEMKEEAKRDSFELLPDAVTYTSLLKGFGNSKDLLSVLKIIVEMKAVPNLFIDRVAYTAMIDALLISGSTRDALCVFGEILKRAGENPDLRPKPHVFLALMRAFAAKGDFSIVERLHSRMFPDSVGSISPAIKVESGELLMEAATNNGLDFYEMAVTQFQACVKILRSNFGGGVYAMQVLTIFLREEYHTSMILSSYAQQNGVAEQKNQHILKIDVARHILSNIIARRKGITWRSRAGMVVVRLEVMSGLVGSMFSPYLLSQVSLSDPIEKYMMPFEEANPLHASLELKKVVMRFYWDAVVPIIDDWGSCIGVLHREDCDELEAPLSRMMRGPPPCVTTSTSIGRVIDLLLERRHKMIIVVKPNDIYDTSYSSNSRVVGVFTYNQLFELVIPVSKVQDRTFTP